MSIKMFFFMKHDRCEKKWLNVDDPNAGGNCVQQNQFCQNTKTEWINARRETGKALQNYNAASRKALKLKKILKKNLNHYSLLKSTLKEECWQRPKKSPQPPSPPKEKKLKDHSSRYKRKLRH